MFDLISVSWREVKRNGCCATATRQIRVKNKNTKPDLDLVGNTLIINEGWEIIQLSLWNVLWNLRGEIFAFHQCDWQCSLAVRTVPGGAELLLTHQSLLATPHLTSLKLPDLQFVWKNIKYFTDLSKSPQFNLSARKQMEGSKLWCWKSCCDGVVGSTNLGVKGLWMCLSWKWEMKLEL